MDILAGDGNEQQDGLSAIRGLLLKNWRYTATSVQGSTRTSEHFSTRMQIFLELTTIFSPPTIELWRSRRWPVQATLLLKDGIVLLEHEACQEHWLFSTPSRRGTLPISVGSTTEWLVASQLYNLSDIVKANSAIRHLHCHSEAARGWSWQCIAMSRRSRHSKPRPNLRKKYSDQIWSFWMWSAVKVS